MPPTCLAIINASTASPLSAALTPEWLAGLATALQEQANVDIAAEWGVGEHVGVRVSDGSDIQSTEWVLGLVDGGPPNALGWHDEAGNDVIIGYVDISLESDLDGASQTASHEFAEMLLNPFGNLWVQSLAYGAEYARELCDAVESNRYQASNGYTLSDFVMQSFFDEQGSAPFSYMQSLPGANPAGWWCPGPLVAAPGGYQNARPSGPAYMAVVPQTMRVVGEPVLFPGERVERRGRQGAHAYNRTHSPLSRAARLGLSTKAA